MKNKTNIILIILLVVIAGSFLFIKNSKKMDYKYEKYSDTYNTDDSKIVSDVSNKTEPTNTYSLVEVAKHNNEQSCWTAISGNVYDVTSWIGQHPGGERAILSLCRKDGTSAFTNKHGGQPRPEQELKNFLVGVLK